MSQISTQVNGGNNKKRKINNLSKSTLTFTSAPNDLIDQSASIQAAIEKLLKTYQAKGTAYNNAVTNLQAERDNIIKEACAEAEAIRSKATEDAKTMSNKAKQETIAWESEKAKLAHTQEFQPVIKIDVGGTKFTTSKATLCRCPETMIGAMFSGRHGLPLDVDGYHFIDRDGTHFRFILNFLRAPERFSVDLPPNQLKELIDECEYYGLLDLMFPTVSTKAKTPAVSDDTSSTEASSSD